MLQREGKIIKNEKTNQKRKIPLGGKYQI